MRDLPNARLASAPVNNPRPSEAACWLALLCATFLAVDQADAQDGPVSIRGISFDPVELEFAREAGMQEIGIDLPLQARDPVADDVAVWRMLQFSKPIDRDLRQKLRMSGLRLDRYVDGIYIERVALTSLESLRKGKILRASPRYHPAFKVMPSLRGKAIHNEREWRSPRRQKLEGRWFRATLFAGVNATEIRRRLSPVGTKVLYVHASKHAGGLIRIVFRLDSTGDDLEEQIAEVAQIEGVESIEEIGEFISLNASAAGVNQSGNSTNPVLWEKGITGDGQAINIFDDGVADKNHCFFRGDPNDVGPAHRKLLRISDATGNPGLHATEVAGSAAGDDIDNPGLHPNRGAAWSAKLVLADWNDFYELTSSATPPTTISDELVNAAEYANVHSNSWQDLYYPGVSSSWHAYSSYANDIDDFSRKSEDHLVVAAAGARIIDWAAPATAKNALVVSAANFDGSDMQQGYDEPSPFDQRKPDIAVVGCGMGTSVPVSSGDTCPIVSPVCGTSFAAPHAAGLAALARQYFVDGWYQGESLDPTGSLLKAALINSAVDILDVPDTPLDGWGIARLANTLVFDGSTKVLVVHDIRNTDADALETGEDVDYATSIGNGDVPLKITLVWADPASGAGNPDLNNNLDLRVTAPDNSTMYFGNFFNASGESHAGTDANSANSDEVNNVEQVLINAPDKGEWRIKVSGTNVPVVATDEYGQGFALVITKGKKARGPLPPVVLAAIFVATVLVLALLRKYKDWLWPRPVPQPNARELRPNLQTPSD